MGLRREPFEIDEWYHCYNRGIDKRTTFKTRNDYERFVQLLYLINSPTPLRRDNIQARTTADVMKTERPDTLVSIGAYCLMPNHFHLLIKEKYDGGITTFMQRLGTAYTMYFNIRHTRVGNLFYKPFRSRHVNDDRYFQRVLEYIHCNPADLREPGWKRGDVRDMHELAEFLFTYRYSSLADHNPKTTRAERAILSSDVFDIVETRPLREALYEARAYYTDLAIDTEI